MTEAASPVIEVRDLVVDYKSGKKTQRALHGISFDVSQGECVGFIGANGAGKSTTMKSLLGFIFPVSGSIKVFGSNAGTVESRRRLGYLPEVALYYPFMKARELLELYGGLQGMGRHQLKQRIPGLLEQVGLEGKGDLLLKNFSKGMQQRLGIAQAIIAEPELLIFDELSSGLDPVGRHDLREVLLELRRKGTTIFFSSHELTEVESLCDRVVMIDKGRVVAESATSDLLKPLNQFEVIYRGDKAASEGTAARVELAGDAGLWRAEIHGSAEYSALLAKLTAAGAEIVSTTSKSRSLEDYFISLVRPEPAPASV